MASTTTTTTTTTLLAVPTAAATPSLNAPPNPRSDSACAPHSPSTDHHHEQHLDTRSDAMLDDGLDLNETKARRAVRFALRNSPRLDDFNVSSVLGLGSNGCVLGGIFNGAPVAIKIIYKQGSLLLTTTATTIPQEIAILDALTNDRPHPNILRHIADWNDSRHFYMVTELHGPDPCSSHHTRTNFKFFNPRRNRVESLAFSNSSTDLWAWSMAMMKRSNTTVTRSMLCDGSNNMDPAMRGLNPPPLPHVRRIFAQIASAVHHLHTVGVAHGDIKEENILISSIDDHDIDYDGIHHATTIKTPTIKIADFGHALLTERHDPSRTITSYGTREMSPPQLIPNLHIRDPQTHARCHAHPFKADVFALGLLLFALLHGPGTLPRAVHDSVREGKPLPAGEKTYPLGTMRSDLDGGVVELLVMMTMIEEDERADMDDVIAHPWLCGL